MVNLHSIQGNDAGGLRAVHGGHVDLHLHLGHGAHRGGLPDGLAAGVSPIQQVGLATVFLLEDKSMYISRMQSNLKCFPCGSIPLTASL